MEPPHEFQHLDISSCWPASDETARPLLQKVVPPGASLARALGGDVSPEKLVSAHETLQICLLHMEPFRDCEDDQVQDLRVAPTPFQCQDRPALLAALAQALILYEEVLNASDQFVQELPARLQSALDELAIVVQIYQDLHARRRLSASQGIPSVAKTTAAMQTLTTLVQALTPEHYQQRHTFPILRRRCRVTLFARMRDGFSQHGPWGQRYPRQAVDYSIAVILHHLGIEKSGTHEQIAERLRKLLTRAAKPHSPK